MLRAAVVSHDLPSLRSVTGSAEQLDPLRAAAGRAQRQRVNVVPGQILRGPAAGAHSTQRDRAVRGIAVRLPLRVSVPRPLVGPLVFGAAAAGCRVHAPSDHAKLQAHVTPISSPAALGCIRRHSAASRRYGLGSPAGRPSAGPDGTQGRSTWHSLGNASSPRGRSTCVRTFG